MLSRNCLLKHAIEGKTEGRIEVTVRRGRRRKQLVGDLRKTAAYLKLKAEKSDRTLWRYRFGRRHGSIVRQTMELMWAYVRHTRNADRRGARIPKIHKAQKKYT